MKLSRNELEKRETAHLETYAVHSSASRGRKHPEKQDDRLCFQVDRERILHCRAFRRLKNKTQVFVAHYGDHYRNRLTHSLEVAQVSRGLARTLGLNEDLTEAVALAHDLGHTPFGHAGEHALHECLREHGLSFEHNEQSRRIVEELENTYPNFRGLNLSIEVIEGLMKHQSFWDHPKDVEGVRPSLEAQVVNFGDEIAYQNHDVDDGLRSGLFKESDLLSLKLWERAAEKVKKDYGLIKNARIRQSRTVSRMIGVMMEDIANETERRLKEHKIHTLEDVYACALPLVGFSKEMAAENRALKDFLATRLYFHPEVLRLSERGQETIRELFKRLAEEYPSLEKRRDYLAGMTDSFALRALERWA